MIIADMLDVYARRGGSVYFGEPVTVAEHGLQSAHFAAAAGAPDALIAAALLHDIGHLIDGAPEDIADWETDAQHEVSGGRFLAAHFGPEVYEPVRLHVAAKRYLCATEPGYAACLSAASVRTLQLQSGPMSPEAIERFEAEPFHRDAILLRRCDDQGKVQGLRTSGFDHYRALLARLAT